MSPHVTAELWEQRHPGEPSVHLQRWPSFDPELIRQDTVTMVVQVNGKVRDRIDVDAGISEGDAEAAALASAKVIDALAGAAPRGSWSARRAWSTSSRSRSARRSRLRRRRATTGRPADPPAPGHADRSVLLVEARQHALPHLGLHLVGRVEAEAVDHALEAVAHLAGHLVERGRRWRRR